MIEAQKEAALTKDGATKVHHEAAIIREVMRATEDVAAAAANDDRDIGLQASFKVLHLTLLQVPLDFNVDALDVLVTTGTVDAVVLEAEAEQRGVTGA